MNLSEFWLQVYIWGGSDDDEAFNDLFCFDTNTHIWSKPIVSGTLPAPRIGHSACVINGSMYIFGGFGEHSQSELSPQFYQDVHQLDLKSLKWSCVHTKVLSIHFIVINWFILNCLWYFSIGSTTDLSLQTFSHGDKQLHVHFRWIGISWTTTLRWSI